VDLSCSGNVGLGIKASCDFAVAFMRLHETYLKARYDLPNFPDDNTEVHITRFGVAIGCDGTSATAGITCKVFVLWPPVEWRRC
jgi:hypothetical protein